MLESYRLTQSDVTHRKGEFACPVLKTLSKNDSVGMCGSCHGVLFALRVVEFDGQRIVEPRCLNCLTIHEPLTDYRGAVPPTPEEKEPCSPYSEPSVA